MYMEYAFLYGGLIDIENNEAVRHTFVLSCLRTATRMANTFLWGEKKARDAEI